MIDIFSHTEPGGHRENEDAFAVRPHPRDSECFLGVVADGQGGQPYGGPAARRAAQLWLDFATVESAEQLIHGATMTNAIRLVDRQLCNEDNVGFTTLVGWAVWKNHLIGASCGDSALMLVQGNTASILTDNQRKNPPIGSGAAIAVQFGATLEQPWTIVAISDGVWKYAGWENLIAFARKMQGQELIDAVFAACQMRSGRLQDDFTMVLWQSPSLLASEFVPK